MSIATLSFSCANAAPELTPFDIDGLRGAVLGALDSHFPCYDLAAKAQQAHRRVRVELEGDNLHLFGAGPARPFWLAVNPEALPWETFVRAAATKIEPFRFSIRFTALSA